MTDRKGWAKILRVLGIIFMGITAIFTLMAGIGTTCVAFAAEKFSASMALIAPYKWLYILFVIFTTAIGVMMIRATVMIIKSKDKAYRYALITLILGIVIGLIHIIASRAIRGKSMPTDGVVYMNVLTLILFLIFRIPALWKEIDFSKPGGKGAKTMGAAFTLILCRHCGSQCSDLGSCHPYFYSGGYELGKCLAVANEPDRNDTLSCRFRVPFPAAAGKDSS